MRTELQLLTGLSIRAALPAVVLSLAVSAAEASSPIETDAERMILGCYENELASTPNLAAELEVTWTIAPSGRVSSAAVTKHTMHHPGLERCLLETVSGWRFPAFTGEPVTVAYPFYFAPL